MSKFSIQSKSQQSGFTLIELVVVIVILGIMAATALPKFADIGSDARAAKVRAAEAAIKGAMAVSYAACSSKGLQAAQSTDTTKCQVTFSGIATAPTMHFGYPLLADIDDIAGLSASDYSISGGAFSADSSHTTNCTTTYVAATGANAAATVTTNVSGC